jgi:hypothetical protein
MVRRGAAAGGRPRAAPRLSSTCAGWVLPGMAQVRAGCETTYSRRRSASKDAARRSAASAAESRST